VHSYDRTENIGLIAACLKAGAIVGGASSDDADKLYEIGKMIGIAFQLQDDVLDTFGNEATFGKKIGGDIRVNKKTYLLIKALQTSQSTDKEQLINLMSSTEFDEKTKYDHVVALYNKARVKEQSIEKIEAYFQQAMRLVDKIQLPENQKSELKNFINELLNREN
ncbi:MAG: polyprenyl synthetase family protein, partial [Bacteroidales bacterium]|nr:polyprenyl synthetase family protein [Bacteroidales bacterium]